jgi:hypothetical protein
VYAAAAAGGMVNGGDTEANGVKEQQPPPTTPETMPIEQIMPKRQRNNADHIIHLSVSLHWHT